MALSKLVGSQTEVLLWSPLADVQLEAQKQLIQAASLPSAYKVLAMPDVHAGTGVTVGAVVALLDAVCPNIVGVDIGCGMMAYRTNLTVDAFPKDLERLRLRIEEFIPCGAGKAHERALDVIGTEKYAEVWERFVQTEQQKCSLENAKRQMGSLGGGNHFIEINADTDGRIWLMLHSGSRNFGLQVAQSHAWKAELLSINQTLPDRALSVLPRESPDFNAYWQDMLTAQMYARLNRDTMFELLVKALDAEGFKIDSMDVGVNCHHNYASEEEHDGKKLIVARKGAISARKGELGIIPGAMGRKSFIVEGLGSPESLMSASHGAGRLMSRTQAKKQFDLDDLRATTKGVECYIGDEVLDEIALAYKKIETVMANQTDLVRPLFELRSLLTIKGRDGSMWRKRKGAKKDRDNDRREARSAKDKTRWAT